MVRPVVDAEQRREALDPARSFIVQAPAGAGKTGLLTQRFLRLLATVDEPEEILAITFTRKAATEMRNRILGALQEAEARRTPSSDHDRETAELATAALQRSQSRNWALIENPGRLQVRTIDSLCHSLARRLPLLSRSGGPAVAVDDAGELYRLASRRTLTLTDDDDFGDAVTTLLGHLDNNPGRAENLLATMLARRDQWLRHLGGGHHERLSRTALEASLQRLVDETLDQLESAVPEAVTADLWQLAAFAASNLPEGKRENPLGQWDGAASGADNRLSAWRAASHLLLTQDAKVRSPRGLNKNLGFPAPGKDPELKDAKDRMTAVLSIVSNLPGLVRLLEKTRGLPPPRYEDGQWALLERLPVLLNLAYAQLRVIFSEQGVTDHTEVNSAAGRALGDDEAPTDLALALEYHLKHILVDEFQDTSRTQYDLLRRLTAGWQPGDGHSFFAVGDPMQSIYRFRQAEVGLFIETRDQGLGDLLLQSLVLQTNFRSEAPIVDWVNDAFARLFPAKDDCDRGAIRYAPATAHRELTATGGVGVHPLFDGDEESEAREVVSLVEEAEEEGCETIAVLARSRTHLHSIASELSRQGKSFQAVDVQRLGERLAVRELRSLTRALISPEDRAAWLAVLRAPWCGLTLTDLTLLVGEDPGAAIKDQLGDEHQLSRLSDDGRRRALHVHRVMRAAIEQRRRSSLRRLVESTWLALGGPACLKHETDLAAAQSYLELIGQLESAADLPLLQLLDESLSQLFAPVDPKASERIQLMTAHKAKGLEFDAVILPGLGRQPRGDDRELVQWLEWEGNDGESHFVVAPIAESDAGDDPLEQLLRNTEKEKQELEACRLLYVVATRARKRLHLVGNLRRTEDPDRLAPRRNTLLSLLWPVIGDSFRHAMSETTESQLEAFEEMPSFPPLIRAESPWKPPPLEPLLPGEDSAQEEISGPEYEWAGTSARHIGTVIHRYLERIANEGLELWNADRIHQCREDFQYSLASLAVPQEELERATRQVITGLVNTLEDERGRWILSSQTDARSEYAVTALMDGHPVNLVIDRTFVDDKGIRWIIDYKTGYHEGGGVKVFLDREEERYRPQLERYGEVLAQFDDQHPIRLALYFPLLKGWREWPTPI